MASHLDHLSDRLVVPLEGHLLRSGELLASDLTDLQNLLVDSLRSTGQIGLVIDYSVIELGAVAIALQVAVCIVCLLQVACQVVQT